MSYRPATCAPGTCGRGANARWTCPHGHDVDFREEVDVAGRTWTVELAPECCGAGCVAGSELRRWRGPEE